MLVTIPDCARQLGVPTHVVKWLVSTGQVPYQRVGNYRLVRVAHVQAVLEKRGGLPSTPANG